MKNVVWPNWPQYGGEEERAVLRVIRSNQLFAAGEVRRFEEAFADYIGVTHAVGLGNATQGLHLALAALDIGVGDEVIVTPYSWISSASCVLMQNAVPVFADCESETLGLDPKTVEAAITGRTKAIVMVHMFGYPAKVIELVEVGRRHGIPVIEDASHAPGATVSGKKVGSFGEMGVFSLHQRKAISVGDGGIVTTNSAELAGKIQRLRSFGDPELSYNYRMTEFAGALGTVGLAKLDVQNAQRIENALLLRELLQGNAAIKVRLPLNGDVGVYYTALLEVADGAEDKVEQFLLDANARGLPITRTWRPLHRHPHFNPRRTPARGLPWEWSLYQGDQYRNTCPGEMHFPVAERYCDRKLLELNIHPPVGKAEIGAAAEIINQLLG